jgi:hypothetical protein
MTFSTTNLFKRQFIFDFVTIKREERRKINTHVIPEKTSLAAWRWAAKQDPTSLSKRDVDSRGTGRRTFRGVLFQQATYQIITQRPQQQYTARNGGHRVRYRRNKQEELVTAQDKERGVPNMWQPDTQEWHVWQKDATHRGRSVCPREVSFMPSP